MRTSPVAKVLRVTTFVVFLIAGVSLVVMELWNALLPDLFGWQPISYVQGVGILILSRILFGGFRGGAGPAWHWKRRMVERWHRMTPDERQTFRQALRSRA